MYRLVLKLFINMIALLVTAAVIPGIAISGPGAGLWAAFILGLVNIIIKPIFTLFTLPVTILTLGLFLFVINGIMLAITAGLVPGFMISGLFAAIIGSLVFSFFARLINEILN